MILVIQEASTACKRSVAVRVCRDVMAADRVTQLLLLLMMMTTVHARMLCARPLGVYTIYSRT